METIANSSIGIHFIGIVDFYRESLPHESGYPFSIILRLTTGEEHELQVGDAFVFGGLTYVFDGNEVIPIGYSSDLGSNSKTETIVDKIPTNCKNCGAPLSGRHSCRYCETWN